MPRTGGVLQRTVSIISISLWLSSEICERIERVLKPGGDYVEGTYCSETEEEERQVLSAFERRTAGLDGADSGEWKIIIPLQPAAVSRLLKQAGFAGSE